MSKIRLFHAKIADFSGVPSVLTGELWTEDDRISYVGPPRQDAGAQGFDREIDCRGNLLLPGFKNAHTHAAMGFLRSHADDMPLQQWLFEQVFPYEDLLTPEDIYTLVQLGIMELLTTGVTSMFDMYFHRSAAAQSAIDAGCRLVFCNVGGPLKKAQEEYRQFSALHPLISFRMGTHAEYTASRQQLEELVGFTREVKEPFCTHLHETASEVQGCIERYGMRPLALLEKMGAFEYGGTGYHLVHLDERDMEILKDHGMYAVTCPASNAKLASGVAPIVELMERGIPVAIGTDGAASNNCLDMFREMFLVTGLQKLRHGADACDALAVLKMACVTGAHAMYLPDYDALLPGKQADVVMLDLHRPNMQPENNILKNVVYSGSKENVALTMVAGRILYEKGAFLTIPDPEKVYADSAAVIARMRKSLGR